MTDALEGYRFSEAASVIYKFTWTEFCDWYIEMAKGRLKDPAGKGLVLRVLVTVLDGILRMVHPIMPFVSETIWQALNGFTLHRSLTDDQRSADKLIVAPWPTYPSSWMDQTTESQIGRMQELIRAIREIRNRYQINPKTSLDVFVRCSDPIAEDFTRLSTFITMLAGVGSLVSGPAATKPQQASTFVHHDFEAYTSLQGLIDVAQELKRLEKQLAEKKKQLSGIESKLKNEGFLSRATPEVVQEQRDSLVEVQRQIAVIEMNLTDLQQ
jgi:valyl-tRNA synthetase